MQKIIIKKKSNKDLKGIKGNIKGIKENIKGIKKNIKGTIASYKRARNWCFTDFELLNLDNIYNEYKDIIRYLCYGKEICPKTKKIHYQGWLQLNNPKSMNSVKKILGTKKIHLEQIRSNEINNDKYCKKEGNYKTFGKYIYQGKRTDLEQIKKMIENNEPMINIGKNYFNDFIRYNQGFKEYRRLIQKENTKKFREINTTLINGPTGCGKTREAMKDLNNTFKITGKQLQKGWWDGYEGEKVLVIDEYNNDIGITELLNILDGYQLRLPIKGSFTYANWNKIYITTNLKELHNNAKIEHKNALNRRINKYKNYFKKNAQTSKNNSNIVRELEEKKLEEKLENHYKIFGYPSDEEI